MLKASPAKIYTDKSISIRNFASISSIDKFFREYFRYLLNVNTLKSPNAPSQLLLLYTIYMYSDMQMLLKCSFCLNTHFYFLSCVQT